MPEVCEVERNWLGKSSQLQFNSSLARCKKTRLTGPLEYKYRVIFVLVIFVLYEVQLYNKV